MQTTTDNTVSIGLQMIANSVADTSELAMIHRWRQEYERAQSRNRKPRLVLQAVKEGYDTVSEIVFYTNLKITSVRRIITHLIATKRIKQTVTKNQNFRHELRFEPI